MNLDPYTTPFDDENQLEFKHQKLLYRSLVIYYLAKRFLIDNEIAIAEFPTWREQKPRAESLRVFIYEIIDEHEHSNDAETSDNYRSLKPEILKAQKAAFKFGQSLNGYSAELVAQIRRLENSSDRQPQTLDQIECKISELNEILSTLLMQKDVGGKQVSVTRDNLVWNVALLFFYFTETVPKKNFKKAHGKLMSDGKFEKIFVSSEIGFIRTISGFVDPTITDANIVSCLKKMDFSLLDANTPAQN